MRKYLRIYALLLKLNFSNLIAYRMNFVNSLVASTSWCLFMLLSMFLLTRNVKSIYGWSREEILLLSGSFNIIIGITHFLFSRNFERFSNIVHLGQLDAILLKPVDSQFMSSMNLVGFTSLFRIAIGIAFNLYILSLLHIQLHVINVVGFIILTVFSVLLVYGLWSFCCTFIIWQTRLSNIVYFLYSLNGVSRYPREMYKEAGYFVFMFLLPLTFVLITPTRTLINRALWGDIIGLIAFSVVFFSISRWFWKFALRSYTSASG